MSQSFRSCSPAFSLEGERGGKGGLISAIYWHASSTSAEDNNMPAGHQKVQY